MANPTGINQYTKGSGGLGKRALSSRKALASSVKEWRNTLRKNPTPIPLAKRNSLAKTMAGVHLNKFAKIKR